MIDFSCGGCLENGDIFFFAKETKVSEYFLQEYKEY